MRLVTRGALALLLGATLACGNNSDNGGISPACDVVVAVQPLDADNRDQNTSLPTETIARFEGIVDRLMRDLKTPGLSALILKDQQIVWERGFGFADVEAKLEATPDTVYGLASVTKALASVVFFRSLENGCVGLDDPASMYDAFADSYENAEDIKLRHLMSHTSLDPVGTLFEYDGNRYGGIGNAIKRAFGVSFKEQFQRDIAAPLGMTRTAANPNDPEVKDRFASFLRARGHKLVIRNDKGRAYKLIDGFEYTNRRWGQSYLLLESMIDNALTTTSYGKGLFENRHPTSVDAETLLIFSSFFLNDP
jgi:CubicO group peptidase (beta-lactamase class C family)